DKISVRMYDGKNTDDVNTPIINNHIVATFTGTSNKNKLLIYSGVVGSTLNIGTSFTHVKLELGSTATPYLKDGDYMKYTGTSVKDSNNPTDDDWAKTSAKHTDVDEAVVIAKKYTDTSVSLIPGQITAGVKESKEYADNAANGALAGSK